MPKEQFPGEHYYFPPEVNLHNLAHRAAVVTGNKAIDPYSFENGDSLEYVSLRLGGDASIGTAQLLVGSKKSYDNTEGSESTPASPAVIRNESVLGLGQYNPADKRWHLYPELVTETEEPALVEAFSGLVELIKPKVDQDVSDGYGYIDYFHPVTQLARQEMADRLHLDNLGLNVFNRARQLAGDNAYYVDDQTLMYFTKQVHPVQFNDLTNDGVGTKPGSMDVLSVCYEGILLKVGDHINRTVSTIQIAHSEPDPEKPMMWFPVAGMLEPHEMDVISEVLSAQDRYKQLNFNFSETTAAVAPNLLFGAGPTIMFNSTD